MESSLKELGELADGGNAGNRRRGQLFEKELCRHFSETPELAKLLFGDGPFMTGASTAPLTCLHTGDDSSAKSDLVVKFRESAAAAISLKSAAASTQKTQLCRFWAGPELLPLATLLDVEVRDADGLPVPSDGLARPEARDLKRLLLPLVAWAATGVAPESSPLTEKQAAHCRVPSDMLALCVPDGSDTFDGYYLFAAAESLVHLARSCAVSLPAPQAAKRSVSLSYYFSAPNVPAQWLQLFMFTRKGGKSDKGSGQLQLSLNPAALEMIAAAGLLPRCRRLALRDGNWSLISG